MIQIISPACAGKAEKYFRLFLRGDVFLITDHLFIWRFAAKLYHFKVIIQWSKVKYIWCRSNYEPLFENYNMYTFNRIEPIIYLLAILFALLFVHNIAS